MPKAIRLRRQAKAEIFCRAFSTRMATPSPVARRAELAPLLSAPEPILEKQPSPRKGDASTSSALRTADTRIENALVAIPAKAGSLLDSRMAGHSSWSCIRTTDHGIRGNDGGRTPCKSHAQGLSSIPGSLVGALAHAANVGEDNHPARHVVGPAITACHFDRREKSSPWRPGVSIAEGRHSQWSGPQTATGHLRRDLSLRSK